MTIVTYNVKVGQSIEPFEIKESTSTDQAFGLLLEHDKFYITKDFHNLPNIEIISSDIYPNGKGATVIANSEHLLTTDVWIDGTPYWYKVIRNNSTSPQIFVDGILHGAYDDNFIYCHSNARLFQYKTDETIDEEFEQIPIEVFPINSSANQPAVLLDGKYKAVGKQKDNIKIAYNRPQSDEDIVFLYEVTECANFALDNNVISIKKCSFTIDDVKYLIMNTNNYRLDTSEFLDKGFTLNVFILNGHLEYIAKTADRVFSSNPLLAANPTLSIVSNETVYSVAAGPLNKINQTLNSTIDEIERLLIIEAKSNDGLHLGTFTKSINDSSINLVTYLKQANLKEECYEYATQDLYGSAIVVYGDITHGYKDVYFPDSSDIVYMDKNILVHNDIVGDDQLQIDIGLLEDVANLTISETIDKSLLINNNPYEINCSVYPTAFEDQVILSIDGTNIDLSLSSIVISDRVAIIESLTISKDSQIYTYINTSPQQA